MVASVSIIIPVYNVEEYLPECLESVTSQTLENIEVICVNDCSTDNSSEILKAYADDNEHLVVIDHDRNQGQAIARNTGIEYANGEYIFFLDPDDLLFSNDSLKHLYGIARRDDADEVIGATLRWYEQTGERLYEYHKEYLKNNLNGVLFQDHQYLRHNAIACNKLLKRTFIAESNIFFNTDLRKFEDNVFSWKTHLQARSISLTVQATYLHRIRSAFGNKSVMQNKEKDTIYHLLAASYMLDFFDRMPDLFSLRPLFDRYYFSWCFLDVQELDSQGISTKQKKEILERYLSVLTRVPESSLTDSIMPKRYLEGISLLQKGEFEEAWEVFAAENYQALCLTKQLDNVYNSASWKLTAPLRKINKKLNKQKSL